MATLIATTALVILFAGIQHLCNWLIRIVNKNEIGFNISSTFILIVLNAVFSVMVVNLIIQLNR